MGQAGKYLRRARDGYAHWCPACLEMHKLPDSWTFVNRDLDKPTFAPSFRITGVLRDAVGEPLPYCCHYVLTAGVLHFCGDCTHAMAGRSVPLPELPEGHRD